MQALAALLIPARIGGSLVLTDNSRLLTNMWRRDLGASRDCETDGRNRQGRRLGGLRRWEGGTRRIRRELQVDSIWRRGRLCKGGRLRGHRRDFPDPHLAYRGRATETQGGTCGASGPAPTHHLTGRGAFAVRCAARSRHLRGLKRGFGYGVALPRSVYDEPCLVVSAA